MSVLPFNTQRKPIEIRRVFQAPAAQVFEALTNPELLKRWAAPHEHRVEHAEVDLRVGGQFLRIMRFPDGSVHRLRGVYQEIEAPKRLVYTFRWETIPELPETLVTVELSPGPSDTEVVIRHEGFEDAEARADHTSGWDSCLENLAMMLEAR